MILFSLHTGEERISLQYVKRKDQRDDPGMAFLNGFRMLKIR